MANTTSTKPVRRAFSDFTEAAAGLKSLRAILLLILALPLAMLVGFIFSGLVGLVIALLGGDFGMGGISVWKVSLMSIVFLAPSLLIASSPAGVVLMDGAQGFPERSIGDALLTGLVAGFKVLVSLFLAGLLFLIWIAAIAVALYLCKLPFLGPLLFAILIPIATVISGLMILGFFLSLVVIPPAIWGGLSVFEATMKFYRIIQNRTLEVFIRIPRLYLTVLGLAAGVALILVVGNTVVGLLAEGILHIRLGIIQQAVCGISFIGSGGGSESLCQAENGVAGLFIAKTTGGILLFVISNCSIGAIVLMAINLLYLDLSDGLERESSIITDDQIQVAKVVAGDVGDRLKKALHGARVATEDASVRLKERLHEAEERARQRGMQGQDTSGPVCAQCGSQVSGSDTFCGSCGARLEAPKLSEQGES